MIQFRNNVFETNSSSSHSLCVMKRPMYDDWRNGKIALSIHYIWDACNANDYFGTGIEPSISLPENFIDDKKSFEMAKEKYNDPCLDYRFENLRYGDNGFMQAEGNFDTYAPIVRQVDIDKQKEENIKILDYYISNTNNWFIEWLKEDNKYNDYVNLINQYKETGEFTEEMYKKFPIYLFYTPEQYTTALRFDDCYSQFMHLYEDVVAFGYYFHS